MSFSRLHLHKHKLAMILFGTFSSTDKFCKRELNSHKARDATRVRCTTAKMKIMTTNARHNSLIEEKIFTL